MSWTIKTLSENIVLIDIASISLIPVLLVFYSFIADAIGFGIIKFGPEICSVVKSEPMKQIHGLNIFHCQ